VKIFVFSETLGICNACTFFEKGTFLNVMFLAVPFLKRYFFKCNVFGESATLVAFLHLRTFKTPILLYHI